MAGKKDIVEQALKLIFSGSKAVDEVGVPVRYYHGTTKDLPVIKPGTYFTEDPGEGSAYTFWTDLKNAEKHKGKYSVISAPELAGKRLEYFGTISDIDDPKVGEFYATDNGIMRYKGNGTWDVASDVGIDSGSLDMSDYTIGIKSYDNSEAAKQMVDEYEEAVKRVYPGGVGGNVIPAYLNVKNPKEMSPLEGNRFGERLGADPKWVADEIERLKAQGYDSIVTTSDDPFYAMEGKKPPKQYVIFDPTQAKSAIGNTGEYDFTNPDITKASGGSIRQGYQTKGRVVGDIVEQALKLVASGDPQKTVKAYKLFRQKEGKLYPLFVDANEEVALNQWLKAKAGEQAASGKVKSKLGELAYRPGWHAGDLPIAMHIGARSHKNPKLPPDTRPSEQVWAEVEMADDVDWQKLANERARITKKGTPDPKTAHITDQVPYGGFYRYKTNPNMTGNWLIGGDMRVNRVLTDDEVKAINEAAGVADLPRREGYGPGGWVDDVVKMAGKVISGEGEDAAKAGIRAYHGSPHDFDRFDMSKIGTGEGAQAYGHGLYFAEREGVAKGYRDALSSNKFSYGNVRPDDEAIQKFSNQLSDIEQRKAGLADKDGFISLDASADDLASLQAEEDKVRNMMVMDTINRNPHLQYGRMYEVNINADPNTFLDWDKPLSEQPQNVLDVARPFFSEGLPERKQYGEIAKGGDLYDMLVQRSGGVMHRPKLDAAGIPSQLPGGTKERLGMYLSSQGIPGIKYLDAGSRVPSAMARKELADWQAQLSVAERELADATARGDKWLISRKQAEVKRVQDGIARVSQEAEGTRNYVVFDDKLISIIRKYGIAGASAMLGYNLMEQLDPKQALAASMADQDYQASRPQRSMGGNNSISGALNVARGLHGDR